MTTHTKISERPTHALIMVGHEFRFLEPAEWYRDHFQDKVKIPEENVSVMKCAYMTNQEMMQQAHDVVVKPSQSEPTNIIIAYVGHGGVERMTPNYENPIYYEELACLLREHMGDFVFLNGSCHSGSSIDVFADRGLHKKGLIIASAPRDAICEGNDFEYFLLESFRNGHPFYPGKDIGIDHTVCYAPEEIPVESDGPVPTTELRFGPPLGGSVKFLPQRRGKRLDYLLYPK